MRNKLNTAKPARGRVGICLLKYGMRNANFLNKHKKNRRTGNNFLINAGYGKIIPMSGKFVRGVANRH